MRLDVAKVSGMVVGRGHATNANGCGRSDLSSLSASQAEELDRACDRFEAEWMAGKRPKIEAHLIGIAEPLRSALLEDLIAVERRLLYPKRRCTSPDRQARPRASTAGP
jgi:hypothetical protein